MLVGILVAVSGAFFAGRSSAHAGALRAEIQANDRTNAALRSRLAKDEKIISEVKALGELGVFGPGYVSEENAYAAKANVRASIPAVEAYNADNTGKGASAGYAGMTLAALQVYDKDIVPSKLTIVRANASTYCVRSTVGQETWSKNGPGADIASGPCP
jgi:hypothetical protein